MGMRSGLLMCLSDQAVQLLAQAGDQFFCPCWAIKLVVRDRSVNLELRHVAVGRSIPMGVADVFHLSVRSARTLGV